MSTLSSKLKKVPRQVVPVAAVAAVSPEFFEEDSFPDQLEYMDELKTDITDLLDPVADEPLIDLLDKFYESVDSLVMENNNLVKEIYRKEDNSSSMLSVDSAEEDALFEEDMFLLTTLSKDYPPHTINLDGKDFFHTILAMIDTTGNLNIQKVNYGTGDVYFIVH